MPTVRDHARTVPQCDGNARPLLAGGAVGNKC
jgi:hypothetical protein